jgi:hypothetical protein
MNGPIAFVFATTVVPIFLFIFFVAFVPAGFLALPTTMVNALAFLIQIAKGFNYLVPINDGLTAFAFLLVVDVVMFFWSAFKWLVGVFTGAGR